MFSFVFVWLRAAHCFVCHLTVLFFIHVWIIAVALSQAESTGMRDTRTET